MIEVRDVSKRFVIHHQRATELKERIVGRLKGRRFDSEEFWALRNVSLTIRAGEAVALIGANGSGKSTLLQCIARILVPDGGSLHVSGRVAALLELGAGFNPELTGRENVYLASAIQGFSRREIESRMAEIIEFSELERFIDTPIKNYSTGMYMRLGFSVATHVDPDILLIDEILAVGDEAFQAKCIRRIEEFKGRGCTIVFVSHSMDAVRRICDRAVLLDNGRLALDAIPEEAIRHYFAILGIPSAPEKQASAAPPPPAADAAPVEPTPPPAPSPLPAPQPVPPGPIYLQIRQWVGVDGSPVAAPLPVTGIVAELLPAPEPAPVPEAPREAPVPPPPPDLPPRRYGIGLVRVRDVEIFGGMPGEPVESGGPFTARIHYEAECIVKRPVVGVAIHADDGSHLMGPNTKACGPPIASLEGPGSIDWRVPRLPLRPGTYLFTTAFFNNAIDVVYDFCDRLFPFHVSGVGTEEQGHLAVEHAFSLPSGDGARTRVLATSEAP